MVLSFQADARVKEREEERVSQLKYEVYIWGDENVLKLNMLMVAYISDYTKDH